MFLYLKVKAFQDFKPHKIEPYGMYNSSTKTLLHIFLIIGQYQIIKSWHNLTISPQTSAQISRIPTIMLTHKSSFMSLQFINLDLI